MNDGLYKKFCLRDTGKSNYMFAVNQYDSRLIFIKFQLLRPWPQELDRGQRNDKIQIITLPCGLITDLTAMQFNYMLDKRKTVTGAWFLVAVCPPETF